MRGGRTCGKLKGSASEAGPSKVHFLDSIFPNTQSHTSSCNHSLVSHQLNFLSQIIFHFPEATQKQQEENSPTPDSKKWHRPGYGKRQLPLPVRHEKPSVSTLKFIICNFLQSSCPCPRFVAHFSPVSS